MAHPIGRSLPSFYDESFRPSGLVQGSPKKGSAAGRRRALVSAGVDQDDNAEVLGAKAGLLAGPTLEDY